MEKIQFQKEKDGKVYDIEIEYAKIKNCSAIPPHANFKIRIRVGDTVVNDSFCTHNLQITKNAIYFYNIGEVSKFFTGGRMSVTFVLPDGIYEKLMKINEEKVKEYYEKHLSGEIVIVYRQEVNTYDIPILLDKFSFSMCESEQTEAIWYFLKDVKRIEDWQKRLLQKLLETGVKKEEGYVDMYGLEVKTMKFTLSDVEFQEIVKNIERDIEIEEEERRKKEEEKERKRKQAIEEEIYILDTDQVYSSVNFIAGHSLKIFYSPKRRNIIEVCGETYPVKEELKKVGFRWNGEEERWEIEYSDENLQKTIDIVKKYDKKIDYVKEGYVQCWECGTWFKPQRKDWDGFGWYCGC